MTKKHLKAISRIKKSRNFNAALVITSVAIVGTIILTVSHAATSYTSVASETGTTNGGAVAQTCSGATPTDGKCVVFNGTGGGTTTASCVNLDASGTPTISCGYPGSSTDPTHVGAANGVCSQAVYNIIQNRPSGTYWDSSRGNSLEITGSNINISNYNLGDVNFDVAPSATNFTLNNDCISSNGNGDIGSIIVNINAGASGVVIENSTLTGSNDTTGVVNKIVQDFGTGTQILNNYMDNLVGGVFEKGPGNTLVQNNYIFLNGRMLLSDGTEVHYEPLYCTDNNKLTIDHNTLFNTHSETAAIFCNTNDGGGGACSNIVDVTNNFLAGGGAIIYTCANSSGPGTSDINFDNNRIARCLGAVNSTPYGNGDNTCGNVDDAGADSHGYWPYGGNYDLIWPGGQYSPPYLNWSGNYWDDNLQTVNPTHTGS